MDYPNPCCRCGYCCLHETCGIGQQFYGIEKATRCPGLMFDEHGQAGCWIVTFLGDIGAFYIGAYRGCCIKARLFKAGNLVGYFSDLPPHVKRMAASARR